MKPKSEIPGPCRSKGQTLNSFCDIQRARAPAITRAAMAMLTAAQARRASAAAWGRAAASRDRSRDRIARAPLGLTHTRTTPARARVARALSLSLSLSPLALLSLGVDAPLSQAALIPEDTLRPWVVNKALDTEYEEAVRSLEKTLTLTSCMKDGMGQSSIDMKMTPAELAKTRQLNHNASLASRRQGLGTWEKYHDFRQTLAGTSMRPSTAPDARAGRADAEPPAQVPELMRGDEYEPAPLHADSAVLSLVGLSLIHI